MSTALQTQDGLPDNSVTGMAQTSDGYLWIATRGGLLSYDGQKFNPLPRTGLPPLPSRTVRALFRDHGDGLWLAMERGPLLCLTKNGMTVFSAHDGLPSQRVLMMTEDAQGGVWMVYPGYLRRVREGRVEAVALPEGGESDLTHVSACTDFRGNFWYARGNSLGEWHAEGWTNRLQFDGAISAVSGGVSSNLWVAAGKHLYRVAPGREPVAVAEWPQDFTVRVMLEDRQGGLWVGTAGQGLFHWVGQGWEKVPTSQSEISSLFEDHEENVWAGTDGGGIDLIRPRTAMVLDQEPEIPFESVQSVTEDSSGRIWAVSQDGQLARAESGRWKKLMGGVDWPGGDARCVAADARGGVWVGTVEHGVLHFTGTQWEVHDDLPAFGVDGIRSLLVASNGDVWLAVGPPNRLILLRQGKFTVLKHAQPLGPIRALIEDDGGAIWAGTAEGQVIRVKPDRLRIKTVISDPLLSVRCLLMTKGGHLWIGYAGDGLGHWQQGKYQRLTTQDGLADDFVSQMLPDEHGNLWLNGNRGLSRVAIGDLEALLAGRAAHLNARALGGLDSLPAMQPSRDFCPNAFTARDGHLWFALHGGLLAVQPGRLRDNPYPPPVLIERVTVDDQVTAIRNPLSPMQAGLTTNCLDLDSITSALRVGPNHRKVQINFAVLSYTSPGKIQCRYRLKPFDPDWVDAGANRQVTYPHLPPGNYEFRVVACNNTGLWNQEGARLVFNVRPHFWETWWFKLAGGVATVLLGGAVAAGWMRRRYWQKINRLEARRALEQERARIARDIHDDLGASLTRISLLSQPTRGNPEDAVAVATNLSQIHQTARELTHAMGEVVWAVNPEHDTFDSLANYASHYAQKLLGTAGIRCRIEMPLQLPTQPLTAEVRHNLFLAFKEALNNIIKHAGATEVHLVLTPDEHGFTLLVADNGPGFAPDRPGVGNGLNNMQTRMREIGGDCELRSAPGTGTSITFRVKWRPNRGR